MSRILVTLSHTVTLISNVRTSASKKINGMALIRTLTVSNTAFERTKEKKLRFSADCVESINNIPGE